MAQRRYSLFVKVKGKYERISPGAYVKPNAVHFYQSLLLSGSFMGFAMYLRPVQDFGNMANPKVNEQVRTEFMTKITS
jgi:hypothetical protein